MWQADPGMPAERRVRARGAGFTLVELMVVVGIVAALIAMMLPALARAREVARLTQCASNLHQLVTGLSAYASQWQGRYPPNWAGAPLKVPPVPPMWWYDDARIGQYIKPLSPQSTAAGNYPAGGGVYVCPNDGPGAVAISYAMNVWASSVVNPSVTTTQTSASGQLWGPAVREPSRKILLGEAYSFNSPSTYPKAWYASQILGTAYASSGAPSYTPVTTTAGMRFGGDGGILFTAGRFGKVTSELPFYRHRTAGMPGTGTQPRGRVNLAYADGHVASKTDADLVLPSGVATGDSVWSPADLAGN